MKVLFFTPVFNYQDADIIKNHQYVRETSQHEIDYLIISKGSVEHNKQIAYREFLKGDYDYFFNVDADIMFLDHENNPIDTLISNEKDIVGGIYTFKRPPCQPSHRPLELQEIYEKDGKFPIDYKFTIPEGLHEVKWLAGGCMLISRKVIIELMKEHLVPNLPMIYKKEYLSEDFAFCQRAIENGHKIFADSSINLGHCGNYFFTLEDYKKYINN